MTRLPARLALTTGEPAGIGPEISIAAARRFAAAVPEGIALVLVGDPDLLTRLAPDLPSLPGVSIAPVPLARPVRLGQLDAGNADYVIATLREAADGARDGRYAGIVTAPVHKGILRDGGHADFTGHTEYFQEHAGCEQVVMLLAGGGLRVALATTHLPLREVPDAITVAGLQGTLRILHTGLRTRFGVATPRIGVCGLNPHAGEGGHLGREEIDVIIPALEGLRAEGMDVVGPLPADTIFVPSHAAGFDAILAMYHDQGLPVLKYAGFEHGINVTLGLPYLRTSVDHGTALDLAGSGKASPQSLFEAVDLAIESVRASRR